MVDVTRPKISNDGATLLVQNGGTIKIDGGGTLQSNFGGSAGAATMLPSGNVNVQASAAGVQPGAIAVDSVLAVYSLPAGCFDQAGRVVGIQAQGSFGATANTKRVKLIFNPSAAVVGSAVVGGTTIADTGAVVTNGGGWSLAAEVVKTGALGSNTQLALHQQAQVGGAVAALLAPQAVAAVENGAILVAVTGNATTVVTDILFNFLCVNAQN